MTELPRSIEVALHLSLAKHDLRAFAFVMQIYHLESGGEKHHESKHHMSDASKKIT